MNLKLWIAGARPRTLPAAVVPVAVGTGLAVHYGDFRFGYALLALGVSLMLQIAANFSNDYSDGIRGTDNERSGPVRLVASGLVPARRVKTAALIFYGLAGVMGLALAILSSLWLLVIGVAAILAAWFYTGGPKPYGYYGYGELFVFIFFGIVAVMGTAYVQLGRLSLSQLIVAIPVGISSVCLLVVNNLRDIPSDSVTGKKTLAVRMGDVRTRTFYVTLIAVMFIFCILASYRFHYAWLSLLALPAAWVPIKKIRSGATGRDLIPALVDTGRMQLILALFFSVGIAL